MKVNCYNDVVELCEEIDLVNNILCENESISIIAKFDEAKLIITELCKLGYDIEFVSLHGYDYRSYNDEFIIDICNGMIFCEELKRETGYIKIESFASFVLDNCNSKCLKKNYSKHIVEAHLCDNDCTNCPVDLDEEFSCKEEMFIDEEILTDDECEHSFTIDIDSDDGHKNISFYSTEEIDFDKIKDLVKFLEV